jgi:hypothetical protein
MDVARRVPRRYGNCQWHGSSYTRLCLEFGKQTLHQTSSLNSFRYKLKCSDVTIISSAVWTGIRYDTLLSQPCMRLALLPRLEAVRHIVKVMRTAAKERERANCFHRKVHSLSGKCRVVPTFVDAAGAKCRLALFFLVRPRFCHLLFLWFMPERRQQWTSYVLHFRRLLTKQVANSLPHTDVLKYL